jgi:hypothetical protein
MQVFFIIQSSADEEDIAATHFTHFIFYRYGELSDEGLQGETRVTVQSYCAFD